MPKFKVTCHSLVTVHHYVEVEASDETEARKAAWAQANDEGGAEIDWDTASRIDEDVEQMEPECRSCDGAGCDHCTPDVDTVLSDSMEDVARMGGYETTDEEP